ncbi:MAG: hypothetical protein RR842_13680 [Gordonibacter sp.]|uniref:hypothetical protein n=1 Tax=Gordonibacter sp. TaxID=1968902 RepID=UPI002FC7E1FD
MGQIEKRVADLMEMFADADVSAQSIITPMLTEVAFMERRLATLRELPMIEVHPNNLSKQRPTQAARQYRETMQQYNACIKTLLGATTRGATEEASPLRDYLNMLKVENTL